MFEVFFLFLVVVVVITAKAEIVFDPSHRQVRNISQWNTSCFKGAGYGECGPVANTSTTERNSGCDDGDRCTHDVCNFSTSQTSRKCAKEDESCVETEFSCGCSFTPIQGCCNFDEECDDLDPCTNDTCLTNNATCSNILQEVCGNITTMQEEVPPAPTSALLSVSYPTIPRTPITNPNCYNFPFAGMFCETNADCGGEGLLNCTNSDGHREYDFTFCFGEDTATTVNYACGHDSDCMALVNNVAPEFSNVVYPVCYLQLETESPNAIFTSSCFYYCTGPNAIPCHHGSSDCDGCKEGQFCFRTTTTTNSVIAEGTCALHSNISCSDISPSGAICRGDNLYECAGLCSDGTNCYSSDPCGIDGTGVCGQLTCGGILYPEGQMCNDTRDCTHSYTQQHDVCNKFLTGVVGQLCDIYTECPRGFTCFNRHSSCRTCEKGCNDPFNIPCSGPDDCEESHGTHTCILGCSDGISRDECILPGQTCGPSGNYVCSGVCDDRLGKTSCVSSDDCLDHDCIPFVGQGHCVPTSLVPPYPILPTFAATSPPPSRPATNCFTFPRAGLLCSSDVDCNDGNYSCNSLGDLYPFDFCNLGNGDGLRYYCTRDSDCQEMISARYGGIYDSSIRARCYIRPVGVAMAPESSCFFQCAPPDSKTCCGEEDCDNCTEDGETCVQYVRGNCYGYDDDDGCCQSNSYCRDKYDLPEVYCGGRCSSDNSSCSIDVRSDPPCTGECVNTVCGGVSNPTGIQCTTETDCIDQDPLNICSNSINGIVAQYCDNFTPCEGQQQFCYNRMKSCRTCESCSDPYDVPCDTYGDCDPIGVHTCIIACSEQGGGDDMCSGDPGKIGKRCGRTGRCVGTCEGQKGGPCYIDGDCPNQDCLPLGAGYCIPNEFVVPSIPIMAAASNPDLFAGDDASTSNTTTAAPVVPIPITTVVPGKTSLGLSAGVAATILFCCCGGIGGGIFFVVEKAKKKLKKEKTPTLDNSAASTTTPKTQSTGGSNNNNNNNNKTQPSPPQPSKTSKSKHRRT